MTEDESIVPKIEAVVTNLTAKQGRMNPRVEIVFHPAALVVDCEEIVKLVMGHRTVKSAKFVYD